MQSVNANIRQGFTEAYSLGTSLGLSFSASGTSLLLTDRASFQKAPPNPRQGRQGRQGAGRARARSRESARSSRAPRRRGGRGGLGGGHLAGPRRPARQARL